jgi:hypothetical protein
MGYQSKALRVDAGLSLGWFLVNLAGDTIDYDRPVIIAVRLPYLAIGQGGCA